MNTGSAWEKRALSVLLTVIMVFSMVPLSVFAASGEAEVTVNGSTTNFNSFAGAVEYVNAHGGTLRLLSDVEVPLSENPDDIPFITDAISGITADNVKSSDGETIFSVERQILDIAEAFDDGESTEEEWNKLTEAAARCKALKERIAETAEEISRLTDAVNGYEIDKVTSADKADIEELIAAIDTLLNGDNLTDAERAALEALKGTAQMLLDRIAAAKAAVEADEITAVDGITKDNVKLGDKEALETTEKALEGALRDFDGNYTEEEQEDLEKKLETVKAALAAIGKAEKAADEIGKLPSADDAKLGDKSELDRVQELIDGLTENEKAMLGKDAVGKLDALAERLQRLEEEANSPKTGSVGDLTLWIALLFISGGIAAGALAVKKKQEDAIR